MNLEKSWNSPTKQKTKKQVEESILEGFENRDLEKESFEEKNENTTSFDLKKTEDILEDVASSDLYSWYSTAMLRRQRDPLPEESFKAHFFEQGSLDETFAYGEKEKGYLLGFNKFNVFTPTHFAPKTLRGGYELFQSLGNSEDVPAILAITEDLAETLSKMPSWHKLEIKKEILASFRGELVKKEIYYNSHPEVENLMLGLLVQYMNENRNNEDDEDDDEDYNN